jgi:Flp pilus assembly protein TadD
VALDGVDPAVAAAVRAARERVSREGRSAAAWGQLGKVLRAHTFDDAADECFREAERLDPAEPRWPYFRGMRLADTDPAAAVPFLRRATELADRRDPTNDVPRLLLAETQFRLGLYAEAEAELRRVQAVRPGHPRVDFDLGVVARDRGEPGAAERAFAVALRSPYARQKSAAQLAALCQARGDEAAAAEYDRQAAAPPRDRAWSDPYTLEVVLLRAGGNNRLGLVEGLRAEGRGQEADQIIFEAARDTPGAVTCRTAGIALLQSGRLAEAERELRRALEFAPDDPESHYQLGAALFNQGQQLRRQISGAGAARAKFADAEGHAGRAVDLRPSYAEALVLRGVALRQLGRLPEAVASMREAVRRHPESAENHLLLGELLSESGQRAEAEVCFRRAADLDPHDARPRQALDRLRGDKGK